MKVFISWSGTTSHKVATALREWLPSVIQAVEPFVSSEDIDRGSRWFTDIGNELEQVHFGILCITPQNLTAPWVLFEAGALSKSMGQAHVTPLLIGVKNADLTGPLAQFNTTSIKQEDILKLVQTINKQLKESALPDKTLDKVFEKWWPDLEATLLKAAEEANTTRKEKAEPVRSQGDILEELLELTRGISRQIATKTDDIFSIYDEDLDILTKTLINEYVLNNNAGKTAIKIDLSKLVSQLQKLINRTNDSLIDDDNMIQ